jgi:RNA polymerase sigma-70 factor (ECF subfamily)
MRRRTTVTQTEQHRHDRDLAFQAAHGDEGAWREIYEQSCQTLFSILCYQVGDRDTAKDLLQETFVTAMQKLDSYRGEGSLEAWLRSIAMRKCLDWRRRVARQARKRLAFWEETRDREEAPAEARLAGEEKAFREALAGLSPKQRAALLLREMEDLSYKEIASALGCREATARVHHHRALASMKQRLALAGDSALADEMGGLQA